MTMLQLSCVGNSTIVIVTDMGMMFLMFVYTAICSNGCNRKNGGGICIGPETCVCNNGWAGSNCNTRMYPL